ncbi:hypothetical protein SKAU_G00010100 [Synaphobranchus kaupii]|uniref:Methylcytosine dioxygenase TET n=1 Tax=Synaphobranchus kaupii TaxID=118154 RepID=A0A9Q1JD87_SYNKA|nr:hypothetical protein SKAU_G00010100 [Synaphobranchus kaupii]
MCHPVAAEESRGERRQWNYGQRRDVRTKTVSGRGSVDGPRRREQMDTGSHDRLGDGALSQGLTNGASRRPDEDEEEVAVAEPGNGCAWGPGQVKAPLGHLQRPCWGIGPRRPLNEADIEDARNLVAFSASVGALTASGHREELPHAAQPLRTHTTQLYEKFNQEMGEGEGAEPVLVGGASEGQRCTQEDLGALQTALSQARHGHKPPNCNCDGPDCPDYLEWLEKKIKQAAEGQEVPGELHPSHPHAPPQPQLNGAGLPTPSLAPGPHPNTLPPIPCSPSVLSIAKEKNISLQTAIAIEALTQLSATVPQTVVPPAPSSHQHHHQHHHHHHHHPPQPQHGTRLVPSSPSPSPSPAASPLPQNVPPPGLYPQQDPSYWDQHRPQSRSEASSLRSSPRPSSASPFPNPLPLSDRSSPRNAWMGHNSEPHPRLPPHAGGDPMSELKQLLGDTSGKYINTSFKFPALLKDKGMAQIKQEVDLGDYPGSACAAIGRPAIRHQTQAALQQHLHHKRNLFCSGPALPANQHRGPAGFQDLRKWWPQARGPEGPVLIKQEPKEPKKKKSGAGASPSLKQQLQMQAAGLYPQLGPPPPKPKQIVIKKSKQRASQPTFLPQSQILIQKLAPPSRLHSGPAQPLAPSVTEPGFLPLPLPFPLPRCGSPQADPSCAAPALSQESVSNGALAPPTAPNPAPFPAISESSPPTSASPLFPPSSFPPPQSDHETSGRPPAGMQEDTPVSVAMAPSSLTGLGSLDPKFEELIRQFEAEFPAPEPQTEFPPAEQQEASLPQPAEETSQPNPNTNSGPASPPAPPAGHPASAACEAMELGEAAESSEKEGAPVTPSGPQADGLSDVEKGAETSHDGGPEGTICPPPQPVPPTQEALLQLQQHRVLEDPFTAPFSPLPKRMKIEASGSVAVLSTTACFSLDTPTKEGPPPAPSLRGFLESPLRYLDTPTKSLLDTPIKAEADFPSCDCVEHIVEKDEGPYYNHLGSGPTVASIRELMESRYGEKGEAIRIEKVAYTGKEGKSSQGCPIAKWVIRRASEAEKLLCLVRPRVGHHCANAVIIILILAWEGVPRALGDKLYRELSDTLTKFGNPTSRRCGLNDDRTCACQGKDPDTCGASFSFGCSWSMYFNGCKYARSKTPRKFRLQGDHPKEEEDIRDHLQELATNVAPLYKQLAPQAYSNQCVMEKVAPDCRLGLKEGRPFSGVTACMDFCAHAHKDQHNLHNGCTVVCTLTKEDNRMVGQIPDDEQLHVLPLYTVSASDEFGSEENQRLKMRTGAIQVLSSFRREQENKAIPKQEVKPTIKVEKDDPRYQAFNGVLDGYASLGRHQTADPYSMNSVYSYPGYYARSGLPPNGPPPAPVPAPGPINGFHPNLSRLPYGYYNYPTNALFSPQFLGYDGRNGVWPKPAAVASLDRKPDVQTLQASLAHSYPDHPEWPDDGAKRGYQSPVPPPRPQTAPADSARRATPVIKQEPVDTPQFSDCRGEGLPPQRCVSTGPLPAHQGEAWPAHKLNGSFGPESWEGALLKQGTQASALGPPGMQQVHLFHPHPQQQQQWNSFQGANMPQASPVPSPKLWCKAGEGRSSTPLGLQEKAWRSCGGSVAGCTPPPAPEGRLFPDAFQQTEATQACWEMGGAADGGADPRGMAGPRDPEEEEVWSDSEHNFLDASIGGVAVAPAHGSILIECARRELHATTPLNKPDRSHPTRISLVFYQHKNLNQPCHGLAIWEAKMKLLAERARQRQQEAALLGLSQEDIKAYGKKRKWPGAMAAGGGAGSAPGQGKDRREGVATRLAPANHTDTVVTAAPYAFTQLTGPYSRWA